MPPSAAYIVVAVNVVDLFGRPTILVELLIWVALGIIWALAQAPCSASGRLTRTRRRTPAS